MIFLWLLGYRCNVWCKKCEKLNRKCPGPSYFENFWNWLWRKVK